MAFGWHRSNEGQRKGKQVKQFGAPTLHSYTSQNGYGGVVVVVVVVVVCVWVVVVVVVLCVWWW